MTSLIAHAGHEVHGPAGIALSDAGFAMLVAATIAVLWRGRAAQATWRGRYLLLAGGLLVLAASLAPPLDRAAARTFTAHMVEHLLMMLAAAPLIAASRPELLAMLEMPPSTRWRLATASSWLESHGRAPALLAGAAMFTALWFWHIPGPFDAALGSELVHLLQHGSFIAAAVLFWRFVLLLPPHGTQFFLPRGVLVFATMVYSSALGALLLFSGTTWYAGYDGAPGELLTDQQASGLLMWLAGLPLYLGALGWMVFTWIRRDERESVSRPAATQPPGSQQAR